MSDLLSDLKARRKTAEQSIAHFKRELDEIDLAITAIEAQRCGEPAVAACKPVETEKPKRGAVQKAILDALRKSPCEVAELEKILLSKGFNTNRDKIHNAIQRLQGKRLIEGVTNSRKWKIKEENPPDGKSGLSYMNGAASSTSVVSPPA